VQIMSQSNQRMAKLVVLSEGFAGRSHELKADKTTIGRVEDNALQISEPSVSSHHCEILLRGSDFIVKDLNSTNGTFINGQQVTESPLKPGQILRLGQVELRLESPETAAAAPKKKLEQTRVIPQGVKVGEFEQGTRPVFDKNSPFAKKSNRTAIIFISIGAVLFTIIVICFAIVLLRMR